MKRDPVILLVVAMVVSLMLVFGFHMARKGDGQASAGAGDLKGKPAPDFTLQSLDGKNVRLADFRGKAVLLNFWATWCEPCKKSFPKLQSVYTKYKGQLEIVAISEDDENSGLKEFGDAHGSVKFPLLWDDGKAIAAKWKPPTMPCTFIVDKTGVVKFVHVGYHDGAEDVIEKQVKSLI